MLIKNASTVIVIYTKLSSLSNDHSVYLNLFNHGIFLQENMRISVYEK